MIVVPELEDLAVREVRVLPEGVDPVVREAEVVVVKVVAAEPEGAVNETFLR